MNYDNIPAELRDRRQWVVAGPDKIPLTPGTLEAASVTDPRTWGDFAAACAHSDKFIGFVFTHTDPYVGIDLDAPQNDDQENRHKLILHHFKTYAEVSVSGQGVHLIAKGRMQGKGRRRDKVEVYDRERYFIFTGKQINQHPITDQQDMLDTLLEDLGAGEVATGPMVDQPQTHRDNEVFDMACAAANGDKFLRLADGHWEGDYPSQSEADFALVDMLAFYSYNNEQVRRLFLMSQLGKREKAQRRDYVDRMLQRIRAEQNPPVDVSALRNPVVEAPPSFEAFGKPEGRVAFPAGLIGDCADYIYQTAIRPVHEVALVGALGLVAGLAGRCYNISNTGLNQYLMLVAGTGIGKEGAAQGVSRIIRGCREELPAIYEFIGPTQYASGQALIKQLNENPCQLSIMSEFGHTMKRINRPDATGADLMWRQVLLDIYNKSGQHDSLGKMVYSDTGKNTPSVMSPCLTLLTESAPASLYEGMDEQAIETGLVPRFILVECPDVRPPPNPNAWTPPSKGLVQRVADLARTALSMRANNKVYPIKLDGVGQLRLNEFNEEVDDRMNQGKNETLRNIWNRTHLKALRLAGLVAVSRDKDNPVVDGDAAGWAIDFARRDSTTMTRRFLAGTGTGDSVQVARLRDVVRKLLSRDRASKRVQKGVVTHREITQRTYMLACFKQDRLGARTATQRALEALMDNGELMRLNAQQAQEHFGTRAKCYAVTREFAGDTE